jgi:hypothetical protein
MADIKFIAVFGYLQSTLSSCSTFGNVVIDTCGKFAASVDDTGGKNLPPVLLIPVVHLDLRISPQIFEKMLFSWAWRKMIHEKNCNKKACDSVP